MFPAGAGLLLVANFLPLSIIREGFYFSISMIAIEASARVMISRGDYKAALLYYASEFRRSSKISELASISACLYKCGKYELAAKVARRVIQADVKFAPKATLVLANIESDQGNYRSAWKSYRELLSTSVAPESIAGMAEICKRLGRHRMQDKVLKGMIKRHPENAQANLLIGLFNLEEENHVVAWRFIRKSLELDPECISAWRVAHKCSVALEHHETTKAIAERLVILDPENQEYYEWLGIACYYLALPLESAAAFRAASILDPENLIFFLNSMIECRRIPRGGGDANRTSARMISCAEHIIQASTAGRRWFVNPRHRFLPFAFFIAYSPINLARVYCPYLSAVIPAFRGIINQSLESARVMLKKWRDAFSLSSCEDLPDEGCSNARKIRLGLVSRYFFSHSHSQAFAGYLKHVDRSRFEVVIIHRSETRVDSEHMHLNSMADEVVYLSNSLEWSAFSILSLRLDVLFYTDIGMDPFDFILPEMRLCEIQLTGWGVPHTSGLASIDYYLSSSLQETDAHQAEYSEKLILLDGLPCCFLSETLFFRKAERGYFFLPEDRLIIGCVQSLSKIHPDFDLLLERLAQELPDAVFAVMCAREDRLTEAFMERLQKRAPTAFPRIVLLNRCAANDYLALCDCIDILLDTPYYGAGITAYMSAYVGTPMACFKGSRLRDSTTATIYKILEISDAPVSASVSEYIENVVNLARDSRLRLKIKKDTVEAAFKLYDDTTFIRGFEKFCEELLSSSGQGALKSALSEC